MRTINEISWSELKEGFAGLGFTEVKTYLNNGNVIFSSAINDKDIFSDKINLLIKDRFDLDILVFYCPAGRIKRTVK